MSAGAEVLLASTPRRRLVLSARPLGEGGQATVFGVDAEPALAVKLYHAPDLEIERRLESMLLLAHPDDFLSEDGTGHPALTWPSAMVQDVASGAVIGYAMRRVASPEYVPLGTLFNPVQRRATFPDISWRFLAGVARNLTGLAMALHERDLVLGDLSHANLVVSGRGYLSFLDCDSMQFTDPRSGERFPCAYVTAEYAAPELQREGAAEQSAATDAFSLALLVCRLMLVGDHPFIGIRLGGGDDGHADVAQNIADGYCHLVRPGEIGLPPGTIDPAVLPPPVLALARQTFDAGRRDPAARPTATDWFTALDEALGATTTCGVPQHAYGAHLTQCPWCARVRAGLPDPFTAPSASTARPASTAPAGPATAPTPWPAWAVGCAVLVVFVLVLILLG